MSNAHTNTRLTTNPNPMSKNQQNDRQQKQMHTDFRCLTTMLTIKEEKTRLKISREQETIKSAIENLQKNLKNSRNKKQNN